jgi:ribonuclease P protein subunit POP4
MRRRIRLVIPLATNILTHELIGLEVKVIEDLNPYNRNIKGTIVDEKKNILIIESDKKRMIPKENAVLEFSLDGDSIRIDGKTLIGRPEDRVKRKIKRKW